MGRSGRLPFRNGSRKRKRNRSTDIGSDDSDEDYVVGEDNGSEDDNSEEFCASSPGDVSEESFDFSATSCSSDSDVVRRPARSKRRKGVVGKRKSVANRRKTRVSSASSPDLSEESFDVAVMNCSGSSDEDQKVTRSNSTRGFQGPKKMSVKGRKASVSSFSDDSEDEDADDDEDEEDDEEFMPDVDDCVDDEEDEWVEKKNASRNQAIQRKGSSGCRKGQRKLQNKRKKQKKATNKREGRLVLRRTVSSDDDFFMEDRDVKDKSKKKGRTRKKSASVLSDSNSAKSESSDFEYTISEEERELIREAAKNRNWNSSLFERMQVNGALTRQQLKSSERKGKEKACDTQIDLGKQVCGICLSEEREGIVRGTLNSCFHYFCFNCIMEWSKVESRCPICKQRFTTISKEARSNTGIDLRNVVIKVPRRDQVYQPSEEELRGYLDPYENVVCMECQQGGDDSLMLLCDICDSSAHTYCVGLGKEVPEGNWYCEGCRSCDLRPPNSQVQDSGANPGTTNSILCNEHSANEITTEGFDMHAHSFTTSQHSVSLPQQPSSLRIDMLPSPRHSIGEDLEAVSPMSGGASTVLERRRLRLRIHHLISNNRMRQVSAMTDRADGLPHNNLESVLIPEVECEKAVESGDFHSAAVEGSAQGVDRSPTFLWGGRSCVAENGGPFPARLNYAANQATQGPSATSSSAPVNEALHAELERTNLLQTVLGHEHWRRSVVGSTAGISQGMCSQGCSSDPAEAAKDQVRTMVKSHLTLLAKDIELGRDGFRHIARHSTHTILAACGIKHSRSATIPIKPSPNCPHIKKEGEQVTLMKGYCMSCFNSFVGDVVLTLLKLKLPQQGHGAS